MDILFDKKSYSLTAIQRAVYDTEEAIGSNIYQTQDQIVVTVPDIKTSKTEVEKKLRTSVLDHQIRIKLEIEFGQLRESLVTKAIESSITLSGLSK